MVRDYLFTKEHGKYWYIEQYENLEEAQRNCPDDHEVQLYTLEALKWIYSYEERKYLYEN